MACKRSAESRTCSSLSKNTRKMPGLVAAPGLLASYDCSLQVHLVIGSNSLAGARCTKSLEVGAKVKLITPESDGLHYGLRQRVDAGEIEWIQREFVAEDLTTLGREEVDSIADLVFVTLPLSCGTGMHASVFYGSIGLFSCLSC